jgi:hypothetical protein
MVKIVANASLNNKIKHKEYHTIGTFPISKYKKVQIDIPNTHITIKGKRHGLNKLA